MFTDPSVSDFKSYFSRDFPYNANPELGVTDSDIEQALGDAHCQINEALFDEQLAYDRGFLLLAGHHLVMTLRAASQGIAGQFSWIQSSKSVGSVSESLSIPQVILENPFLAILSKTNYGARYLHQIYPKLTGQIFTIAGATRP